jgi:hypothetical protein
MKPYVHPGASPAFPSLRSPYSFDRLTAALARVGPRQEMPMFDYATDSRASLEAVSCSPAIVESKVTGRFPTANQPTDTDPNAESNMINVFDENAFKYIQLPPSARVEGARTRETESSMIEFLAFDVSSQLVMGPIEA